MRYVIVGIGGQGILFSSRVLGEVAIRRGESIIGSEVHGMAQRGGSVISHFKSGDYKSPLVMAGEADVLLAFDQNEGIRNLHFLRPGGAFVVNVHDKGAFENPSLAEFLKERGISVHSLEGYNLLKEHMGGNFLFLNVLLMGAMCGAKVSDLTFEEVSAAVKELSPPRFEEANMKVLSIGAESVS
ncbi:MAG: 2-oxoacid:acceptor oxidoreductase family protein [Aminivibrio sp.]|jgi:indolepyruvate ferredoxin oxidoreductase beta subunit|nr:indolepyruvate ferredoxin oxidoreductase [Synergistaceae bacterium]